MVCVAQVFAGDFDAFNCTVFGFSTFGAGALTFGAGTLTFWAGAFTVEDLGWSLDLAAAAPAPPKNFLISWNNK